MPKCIHKTQPCECGDYPPQKYQCWKCEGKKYIDVIDQLKDKPCFNCNGQGYIPLIPYKS